MTVRVTLYTFTKKANSTKKPTSSTPKLETEGYIKSPSSLLNPVVELSVEPLNYQYAYIYEFGRYYFITDIVFNRGLWLVSLRVDVMGTYKTTIGASTSYIVRAAAKQNQYLIDNAFPLTGEVTYDSTIFESGITTSYNSGYYIVTTTGDQAANGKTTYQLTPAQFSSLVSALFTTADGLDWGDLTNGIINSLMNPIEYISSVIWSPTAFTTSGTAEVMCGLWPSGITADLVTNILQLSYTVNIPKHPQAATYGKYCNLAPFTHYDLDLGFTGTIPLDTSMLVDVSQILVSIRRDTMTGLAVVEGRTVTPDNQMQLFKLTAPYGVPIPMTQITSNIGPVIQNAVQAGVSAAGGDVLGTVFSTAGFIGSMVEALTGNVTNSGAQGTIAGHQMPKRLFSRFYQIASRDTVNIGKPYCAYVKPSTCSGYQKVANAHIALTNGLDPEVNEINAIMEAGFYYE